MKTPKYRIKFLERTEVNTIIATSKPGVLDHALMHVLFSTGLRVSEALALPRVPFHEAGSADTMQLPIVGKGGYQRLVFFSPACLEAIREYLVKCPSGDSRLFPIVPRTAERIVERAAISAGFDGRKITPHTFRHSLATHLLRSGANLRVVQDILGHKSITSTQVYTGVADKDLLDAHKKFL